MPYSQGHWKLLWPRATRRWWRWCRLNKPPRALALRDKRQNRTVLEAYSSPGSGLSESRFCTPESVHLKERRTGAPGLQQELPVLHRRIDTVDPLPCKWCRTLGSRVSSWRLGMVRANYAWLKSRENKSSGPWALYYFFVKFFPN